MITCPRCGALNGQRSSRPVKCTRCWFRFDSQGGEGTSRVNADREVGGKEANSGAERPELVVRAARGFESRPYPSEDSIVHDPEFCQDPSCRECRKLRSQNAK